MVKVFGCVGLLWFAVATMAMEMLPCFFRVSFCTRNVGVEVKRLILYESEI